LASTSFHITENDTAPPVEATLKAGTPAAAVDLQSSTVEFHMVDAEGTEKVNSAANLDQVTDGSDGTKGKVSYDWAAADTDTVGKYKAEWQITFSDGTIRTFPTPGTTTIIVHGELA
jgi:hypothetical protein